MCVCVLHMKRFFLAVDIQHTQQCPCRFVILLIERYQFCVQSVVLVVLLFCELFFVFMMRSDFHQVHHQHHVLSCLKKTKKGKPTYEYVHSSISRDKKIYIFFSQKLMFVSLGVIFRACLRGCVRACYEVRVLVYRRRI